MEALQFLTATLAVWGVVLNNHFDRRCFWLWMISNAVGFYVHASNHQIGFAARDFVFFALAIHGLQNWRKKQNHPF